ncbi:Glycosyl transferase family 2 [Oribacterium sp. KHPX15]|nr:Glycosyl transferase family 2 [Oribacterium sp. KHPX15]
MKISIITAVYNDCTTIEETILSVIHQTYKNIEYIIIDGASTDGTKEIIEKYKDNIDIFVSEKDNGIYDALNKGIRLASGDVIGILNGDDWYELNALEEVADILNSDSKFMAVAGSIRRVDCTGSSTIKNNRNLADMWYYMPINHPAFFVRREVYERYGEFDTKYKIAADYDFVFRLFVNAVNIQTYANVWTNFRVGGISTTKIVATAEESIEIKNRYKNIYGQLIGGVDSEKLANYNKKQLSLAILKQAAFENDQNLKKFLTGYFKDDVSLYGYGDWGKVLYGAFKSVGINIIAVYDQNFEKIGVEEIYDPDCLRKARGIIVVALDDLCDSVTNMIKAVNNSLYIIKLNDLAEEYILYLSGGHHKDI